LSECPNYVSEIDMGTTGSSQTRMSIFIQ